MKVPLKFPVDVDGTHYDSVTLRRARGKDMRTIAKYAPALAKISDEIEARRKAGVADPNVELSVDMVDGMLAMVSASTGLAMEVVEEFDYEDVAAIVEKSTAFFPQATSPSPDSGEPSSPPSPTS